MPVLDLERVGHASGRRPGRLQRDRAGRQVPLRSGGLHQRHPLLQGRGQLRAPTSAACGAPPARGWRRPPSRGESATGWQQVDFATPVAVTANTTYVASYFAPNGHYAATKFGFTPRASTTRRCTPCATAPKAPMACTLYSGSERVPDQLVQRAPTTGSTWSSPPRRRRPDTTPPTISGVQAGGLTARRDDHLDDQRGRRHRRSSTARRPATARRRRLMPALVTSHSVALSGLSPSTHVPVSGQEPRCGRQSGNVGRLHASRRSIDSAAKLSVLDLEVARPRRRWPRRARPARSSWASSSAPTRRATSAASASTRARPTPAPTSAACGTAAARAWRRPPSRVRRPRAGSRSASRAPVAITANTTYVASYHAPNGGFAVTSERLWPRRSDNAPLHALGNAAGGGNGVYQFGPSAFPNQSYQASNYWVDVVFTTTPPAPDTTPPTISGVQSSGLTRRGATIAWTTNEAVRHPGRVRHHDRLRRVDHTRPGAGDQPLVSAERAEPGHAVPLSGQEQGCGGQPGHLG